MKKMLVGVLEGFMSCVSSHRRTMGTLVCFLMLTALPQTLPAVTLNPGDILIVLDPNAFADGSGGVIRIDPVTRSQTLIAFNDPILGSHFVDPTDLALDVDAQGNVRSIFVVDYGAFGGGGGVISVNPTTGVQTPVTFNDPRFRGPGVPELLVAPDGIAFDAGNRRILIAESVGPTQRPGVCGNSLSCGAVIGVNPDTGFQTLISTNEISIDLNGNGFLSTPQAIGLDLTGRIVVVDRHAFGGTSGGLIAVGENGAQTAISPGGMLGDPHGFARDSAGNLYVVDPTGHVDGPGFPNLPALFMINPVTGAQTTISRGQLFSSRGAPIDLARTESGNFLVVTAGARAGGVVICVDPTLPATSNQRLFADGGFLETPFGGPHGIAIVPGGPPLSCNRPPTANAGPDQTVHAGTVVTLDGSASSDPDGDMLTFAWSFLAVPPGSTAALSNPAAVMPTFTPDRPGDYVVQLVVTDAEGAVSTPDTVTISTTNSRPVAEAGPDRPITVIGTTVCLDGTQSFDPDGDPITYQWSFDSVPVGSNAFLDGANTATPCFVADVHGDYQISLVVTDTFGAASDPDSVTVRFDNVIPVADAGTSQSVLVGETTTLNGSGSSDANGDPLTYRWAFTSVPAGSLATIANPTAAITSFVLDVAGTYTVQLIVNDGIIDSNPATVQIQAVSRQTRVIQDIRNLQDIIASLSPSVFRNVNLRNALINQLNAVIANIEAGNYQDAFGQLQNSILGKTDGCANSGAPDNNDWIRDCASQNLIYPALLEIIDQVRILCGC